MRKSNYLYAEGAKESVEWMALASVVVIIGMTCAAVVLNSVGASASNAGSHLEACEAYAAQHNGSTAGC